MSKRIYVVVEQAIVDGNEEFELHSAWTSHETAMHEMSAREVERRPRAVLSVNEVSLDPWDEPA